MALSLLPVLISYLSLRLFGLSVINAYPPFRQFCCLMRTKRWDRSYDLATARIHRIRHTPHRRVGLSLAPERRKAGTITAITAAPLLDHPDFVGEHLRILMNRQPLGFSLTIQDIQKSFMQGGTKWTPVHRSGQVPPVNGVTLAPLQCHSHISRHPAGKIDDFDLQPVFRVDGNTWPKALRSPSARRSACFPSPAPEL